tara:strand:+ start:810 stop:1013 length:204 start_codon:yes stop_codon:yes gene_type:complete
MVTIHEIESMEDKQQDIILEQQQELEMHISQSVAQHGYHDDIRATVSIWNKDANAWEQIAVITGGQS